MNNNIKIIMLSNIFCTIFKVGNFKYIPGTLGSLIGILVAFFLKNTLSNTSYILIIFLICILAIFAIDVYQSVNGKEDKSEIIIDEFIGQQIPLFFIELTIFNIALCFIFFRFFDILKIFPADYIDRNFKGSLGIIADDLVAGFQALAVIYLIMLFT